VLAYFGDEDARSIGACAACDVCLGTGRREVSAHELTEVRAALACVERLRGRFGRGRVAGLLAGNDDDERMSELPERGLLRGKGVRYGLDLLRALEGAGLIIASSGEYPTISITQLGRRVADGSEQVPLAMPDAASAKRAPRKRAPGPPRRRRA
jgi:superfamily II DNA helicase RecQ